MAKYIFTAPEYVTFVKRDDKGNTQLEVGISNFHNDYGIAIHQENSNHGNMVEGLNLEEVAWLLDVLQDAEKILQMKQEEDNGE